MTPQQLEYTIYFLFFTLGVSVSELYHAIIDRNALRSIAKSTERFVEWAEKEDRK